MLPLLDDIFRPHHSTLLKAVPQNAIFCISCWLGLQGILMCLSVPFLIIPSAPTITGTMVVLRCQIFFNLYFEVFVFSYFIVFFDCYVIISRYCHIHEKICFLSTITTISRSLLFIFLSVWIAKSLGIVAAFVPLIGSGFPNSLSKWFYTRV